MIKLCFNKYSMFDLECPQTAERWIRRRLHSAGKWDSVGLATVECSSVCLDFWPHTSPWLLHRATSTNGNRSPYEALLRWKMSPTWRRLSTVISTTPWLRIAMCPLLGTITSPWRTLSKTTWCLAGSEPSNTTMTRTPR